MIPYVFQMTSLQRSGGLAGLFSTTVQIPGWIARGVTLVSLAGESAKKRRH